MLRNSLFLMKKFSKKMHGTTRILLLSDLSLSLVVIKTGKDIMVKTPIGTLFKIISRIRLSKETAQNLNNNTSKKQRTCSSCKTMSWP